MLIIPTCIRYKDISTIIATSTLWRVRFALLKLSSREDLIFMTCTLEILIISLCAIPLFFFINFHQSRTSLCPFLEFVGCNNVWYWTLLNKYLYDVWKYIQILIYIILLYFLYYVNFLHFVNFIFSSPCVDELKHTHRRLRLFQ